MNRILSDNLKNLRGWRTPRKLVAFAVDDYANVRVASKEVRQRLVDAGLDLSHQMDRYDALETRQDLEALFDVLDSVRDSRDRPGKFTAYALSANPDFARIRADGEHYHGESVPATFARLESEQPAAYQGAWALWQEGMARDLLQPQFHGREHLNVELFEHKLRSGAPDLLANIEQDSLAGIADDPAMPGVGFTHAFGMHDDAALPGHREILANGLDLFEQVWGIRSKTFTPPAQKLHPSLYETAESGGVVSIDKPFRCTRAMGDGTSRREVNRSGRQRGQNHLTVVRNVVFEPGKDMGFDPVERAVQQVAAAFRWRKPAIISSHRVNFCGHLDEANRKHGLAALQRLLDRIITRWPDVEFISIDCLVSDMA
ncbi:hypothetical protein [Wenzhouxiangella sp. EGI_FJ10305]|uniref:hypothetical protein n=1 Tax=Wenzhouxiangella sp. EGI_FJ10305 TaxID=3243768 RepID=UPI0035E193FB